MYPTAHRQAPKTHGCGITPSHRGETTAEETSGRSFLLRGRGHRELIRCVPPRPGGCGAAACAGVCAGRQGALRVVSGALRDREGL